jgi:hypothetical protein
MRTRGTARRAEMSPVDNLDVRGALERVRDVRWAVVKGVVNEARCAVIVREVAKRSFERLPPTMGPVRQETELLLMVGELREAPSVAALRE